MRLPLRLLACLPVIAGVAACSSSKGPDPSTADQSCTKYTSSTGATHDAVTRHVAALVLTVELHDSHHLYTIKELAPKVTADQLRAADTVARKSCSISNVPSVVGAVVTGVGSGQVQVPSALVGLQ